MLQALQKGCVETLLEEGRGVVEFSGEEEEEEEERGRFMIDCDREEEEEELVASIKRGPRRKG